MIWINVLRAVARAADAATSVIGAATRLVGAITGSKKQSKSKRNTDTSQQANAAAHRASREVRGSKN